MYIWGAIYVKVGNFNFIFIHYHSDVILLVKSLLLKRNINQMFPIKAKVLLSNHSKSEICCLVILIHIQRFARLLFIIIFTPAIVLPRSIFFRLYKTFANFAAFSAILRPEPFHLSGDVYIPDSRCRMRPFFLMQNKISN